MTILFAQPIEQYPSYLAFGNVPTGPNTDPNFPIGFLLTRDPTQVYRIATSGGAAITWDFGRARKWDVVSLVGTSFSPAATWTISSSNDGNNWTVVKANGPAWPNLNAATSVIPTDEDLDPRKGALERTNTFFYTANAVNSRYIKIDIRDDVNLVNTIGRLFVGRCFKPKQTWQYGSSFSFDDTGTSQRTDQGSLASLDGKAIVSTSVKMDFLSSDEMYDFIYEFNYWRKSTGEILVCLDLETKARLQKNVLYATIKDGRRVVAEQFEAWSQTWIVERI